MSRTRPLKLLPQSALRPTSPVDHPGWNYRPLLGRVQRLRFRMILGLLDGERFGRLLEIGYGSGVFLPELALHCDVLHGVDPHPMADEVAADLARHDVKVTLTRAGVESLPYEDGFFDCVVTVSALEYVPAIDAACQEIRRVLAPGGTLAVVTPGATPLWNLALRVATREGPEQYSDRRQKLQPALRRHFRLTRELQTPRFGGTPLRLYTALRLRSEGAPSD
ncbi:class I SAM-dependent methyltransferase [Sphaerisporangium corydalis]|uniref:Class I SAM-dependent methyltransferase n=1 Tax=Sphaerisporangium corydalis TaxID=1441875 RepID=A0ABV9EBT0_9ACTN|nr:class I SAM-dependent methyltransferase [Sphaerisporangium corydalis]